MKIVNNIGNYHPFLTDDEINLILKDYLNSEVKEYEEFIKKYENERLFLFLSNIGENVLNWYEFKEQSKVLEISSDFGQITNVLLNKGLNVTRYEFSDLKEEFSKKRFASRNNLVIKNIEEIESDLQKYDYIIISNVIELFKNIEDAFKIISNLLNENGIMICIFENGNSISSFLRVDSKQGMLYLLNENNNITLSKLEKNLKLVNLPYNNIYYSFPNSYIPSIIYEDEFFINNIKSISYTPVLKAEDIIISNEEDALNQILKDNPALIKYFANSYIIETSKNEIEKKSSMISFNNYRKEEYTLLTEINKDRVYKLPRCKEANKHINKMKEGIKYLNQIDSSFIDNIDKNGNIYSNYIDKYETLDKQIYKEYKENKDLEKVAKIYKDSYSILDKLLKGYDEIEKKDFMNEIPEELLKKMHYLEICPWDMVSKNCFNIDGKYLYFDQEWFENSLPIEFLLYRSVINSYDLVKKINVEELFKILKIDEYIEYFKKINEKIMENILNKKIHSLYTNNNLKLDNLIYALNEVENYENTIKEYMNNNDKQDEYIKILENQIRLYENKKIKNKVKKLFNKED